MPPIDTTSPGGSATGSLCDERHPAEARAVRAAQIDDLHGRAEEEARVLARELGVGDRHLAVLRAPDRHDAPLVGEREREDAALAHHEEREPGPVRGVDRDPALGLSRLSFGHALHYYQ